MCPGRRFLRFELRSAPTPPGFSSFSASQTGGPAEERLKPEPRVRQIEGECVCFKLEARCVHGNAGEEDRNQFPFYSHARILEPRGIPHAYCDRSLQRRGPGNRAGRSEGKQHFCSWCFVSTPTQAAKWLQIMGATKLWGTCYVEDSRERGVGRWMDINRCRTAHHSRWFNSYFLSRHVPWRRQPNDRSVVAFVYKYNFHKFTTLTEWRLSVLESPSQCFARRCYCLAKHHGTSFCPSVVMAWYREWQVLMHRVLIRAGMHILMCRLFASLIDVKSTKSSALPSASQEHHAGPVNLLILLVIYL